MIVKLLMAIVLVTMPATISTGELTVAGGKMYQPKETKRFYNKPLTRQQKIQQGLIKQPRMVTCKLKKRLKAKNGEEVCIYQGQNRTYEMAIERNCPRQYKCKYNPWGEEPNIYSVIEGINESMK